VVTTAIRRSTPIRPQFDRAATIPRPTLEPPGLGQLLWVAALRPKK